MKSRKEEKRELLDKKRRELAAKVGEIERAPSLIAGQFSSDLLERTLYIMSLRIRMI